MNASSIELPKQSPRAQSYFTNVLWNWLSAGANIVIGIFLSPYIIRKLGAEGYGLWALLFSVVGYYVLVDFGFRSAIVRYSAHYWARGELEKINEVINTALAYFSAAGALLLLVTLALWRTGYRFFHISPNYHHEFSLLLLLIGTSWALGTVFNLFGACLEGFQRFDVTSRITFSANLLRAGGCAVALALGQGLFAMGLFAFISQILGYILSFIAVCRVFPSLRFSLRFAKLSVLKELMSYGAHTFLASLGSMLLDYSPQVLIGNALPASYIGYYNLPSRLIQHVVTMVERMGQVTASSTAELHAKGHSESVARLGTYANRYSFALFMPLAIVLLVLGEPLFVAWVGPAFATQSVPLLTPLVLGIAIAVAAQFNSSTILFGMAKHQRYAYGLLAEGVLCIVALVAVLPKYGILGAAYASAALMILSRGLYVPWLVARSLHTSFMGYMSSIYVRPTLTAIPFFLLAFWIKLQYLPGRGLIALLTVCSGLAASYLAVALFTCMLREHREILLHWAREKTRRREGTAR